VSNIKKKKGCEARMLLESKGQEEVPEGRQQVLQKPGARHTPLKVKGGKIDKVLEDGDLTKSLGRVSKLGVTARVKII